MKVPPEIMEHILAIREWMELTDRADMRIEITTKGYHAQAREPIGKERWPR